MTGRGTRSTVNHAVAAIVLGGCAALQTPALAFEPRPPQAPEAVFGFGGVITAEDDPPLVVDREGVGASPHVLGGGYQQFFHESARGLQFGMEVGASVRAIAGVTGELWGGPVIRHDGLTLFETVRISPSFTAALSAVSNAHPGRERDLEERSDGNAHLLFYLGPEIGISRADRPDVEAFWRLHHRSGANRTLGNMRGAKNANVVGLRWRY